MSWRAQLAAAGILAGLAAGAASAAESALGGLRGLQHVWSADTAGRGVVAFGLAAAGHALSDTTASDHYYLINTLQLGLGVGRELELGASLPLRAWRASGVTASRIDPRSLIGWGDLGVAGKLRLPLPTSLLRLGLLARATFPTGSTSRGMSSGIADVECGALLTLDTGQPDRFPPTRLHLNLTRRWNRNESDGFGMAPLEDPVAGGFWPPAYPAVPRGGAARDNDVWCGQGGVEFTAAKLSLFFEFVYERFQYLEDTHWRDHPIWITQGAHYTLPHGLRINGAVDASLQEDEPPASIPRLPAWRFHLGITWSRAFGLGDRDEDGVPDARDACPRQQEDVDGFEDGDGCPDLDNDADGIPDGSDLAPDLPEDRDGFQDEDGRPDLDNDGDGVQDTADGCPNEAEDYDGDRDTDGCPDPPPGSPDPPSGTSDPAPPSPPPGT